MEDVNLHIFSTTPPPFGHSMLKQFCFETSYLNLNNGSYGSIPRPVMAACEKIAQEIEANPDRFMRVTYTPLLDVVRSRVSELIGAGTDECVMVTNATHGVNTVLRNLDWKQGDVVVGTTVTYGAISRTIQYVADTSPQVQLATFLLEFPTTASDVLKNFHSHLRNIARQPGQKIVAVIDSIVSNPGVQLPWEKMVKICKEEGVISIVDAAHSIGQQVDINLHSVDPDFWVSNCHKWLFAKRGCAVLYVPKRNQHLIKTTLPTSFGYVSPSDPQGGPKAPNFIDQFNWTGTIDPTPFLSIIHALNFRKWIGGETEINKYCHNLALTGGKVLEKILKTRLLDESGELTANMVNVELPLAAAASTEVNNRIRDLLLNNWNTYVAHFYHNGKWWVRCSAQIWNEEKDFVKLAEALLDICKTIEKERENNDAK